MLDFTLNGHYDIYNDIKIELNKNQITTIRFNWTDIFREYRYIANPLDYDYRMVLTLNSVMLPNSNLLSILRSENGEIEVENNEEENIRLIKIRIYPEITYTLNDFDNGLFSLDIKPSYSDDDYDFKRLVSGRWSLARNQISSLDYLSAGETEYLSNVVYKENGETDNLSGISYKEI